MKRMIKVNGRSYTFDVARNASLAVETSLQLMSKASEVRFKHTVPIVFGIDGRLTTDGEGTKAGSTVDTETMTGKAALADACVQFSRNEDFGAASESQLAELLDAAGIDVARAVVSA